MDTRLAAAVLGSLVWYEDLFGLHGVPTAADDGLWRSLGPPPPLHSVAKTLRPGVGHESVLLAVCDQDGTVADSFGDLDLGDDGFEVFIDATWTHHGALATRPMPPGWRPVSDAAALAVWVDLHGTPGVFPEAVLRHGAFSVLGRYDADDSPTAGAVLHTTGGTVTVQHVIGEQVEWAELLDVVAAVRPGLPVTDYTAGEDLTAATAAGFSPLGPQRVWRRREG